VRRTLGLPKKAAARYRPPVGRWGARSWSVPRGGALGARLSLQPQRTSAAIVNARTTHCLVHHFSVLDLYGLCIFGRPDCHNRVGTASVCRLAAVRSVTPARQRPNQQLALRHA
jgi:hypothetical protein